MIRLFIDPSFQLDAQEHKLDSYAAFMSDVPGDIVHESPGRDVRRLVLDGEVYFLKRTETEKTSSALENYLSGKMAHSKPYLEMQQVAHLRAAGFDVAQVVAAGEETRLGIPLRGFVLSRDAGGRPLAEQYSEGSASERVRLIGQLGTLTGQLHQKGFFLSIRLHDVFYQQGDQANSMTLIDRETRNPGPKRFSSKRATATLFLCWRRQIRAGERLSPMELKKFLCCYCQEMKEIWDIKPSSLFSALRKRGDKWAR